MAARGAGLSRGWLDTFIASQNIRLLPIDGAIARFAADAFERFGKGTGCKAGLNFGDCLVHAAAKHHDAPLLYKGADFESTDVTAAIPSRSP